ncbi:isoaspartyl peptidase/L-asparaginase family protein [Haliangium sp.]|uniref:isoaspartyl peptidase/L-asparaginase family protein n=1 Tax=Haliangium sp. TaxID=2663208 RepID=UPI003D104857
MAREPALVVHGGAAPWEPAYHERAVAGCRAAAEAGATVLAGGGSAVDAVVAAVRALEDNPVFNAGVGAVLGAAGGFELDASIMDGKALRFGGVAAMPDVRNPVEVARALMDHGPHALLCGPGAWDFARAHGFTPADPAELRTERAERRLAEFLAARVDDPDARPDPGTVGACAIDADGHVAAATSTGGMTGKAPGRVGDTPLPGCGTYADDRGGAVSATGEGEAIMRVGMGKAAVMRMRLRHSANDAARLSVAELGADTGGIGGIICCDRRGRLAAAHNSPHMPFGAGVIRSGRTTFVSGLALAPDENLMDLLERARGA